MDADGCDPLWRCLDGQWAVSGAHAIFWLLHLCIHPSSPTVGVFSKAPVEAMTESEQGMHIMHVPRQG